MEATLGISPYSYLYLKQAKTLSFLLLLMFFLQQSRRTRGQNSFCLEVRVGEVAQTMYTHVSKYKNYKITKRKNFRYDALFFSFSEKKLHAI
jgi:hypothetical protein